MNVINVSVYNKVVEIEDAPVIICGNGDYRLDVAFDSEWKASAGIDVKVARFMFNSEGERKFIDVVMEGNGVVVPVLSNIKEVYVGFYTDTLVTSTPGRILCDRSIKCGGAVALSNEERDALITGTLSTLSSNVRKIRAYAFQNFSGLQAVSFPQATEVGESAFMNCTDLATTDLKNVKTVKANAFNGCTALKSIAFNAERVEDYAYRGCKSLTVATSGADVGAYAFSECSSLIRVDETSPTVGDKAYEGCTALKKAEFYLVETFPYYLFKDCTALEWVRAINVDYISSSVFSGCTALKKVIIGTAKEGVCHLVSAINSTNSAFKDTPIENGAGYIYVANHLVADYRAAGFWKPAASKIFPWVSNVANLANVDTTLYTRACVGATNGGTEYIYNGTSWEVAQ